MSQQTARVTIRDARIDDAPALADCVIEPTVTTFRGLVPEQCLQWPTREDSIANWQNWFHEADKTQFLLVAALDSGEVVGCALAGPQESDEQFAGELFVLGVLPAYQGQGIGRALVVAIAQRLLQQGINSMRVGVLSVNPNRRFYERLGAHYLREVPFDWNDIVLPEAFYGWSDLSELVNHSTS